MYALVGGNWGFDLPCGPFSADLAHTTSHAASTYGAALSCKPLATGGTEYD